MKRENVWATAVLILITLIGCQESGKIEKERDLSESANPSPTKSFDTPDGAIRHFVGGLIHNDLAEAFEASAVEDLVEHFDFSAYCKHSGIITNSGMGSVKSPMQQEINRAMLAGTFARNARSLSFRLGANDERLHAYSSGQRVEIDPKDESLIELYLQQSRSNTLEDLEIVRIDTPKMWRDGGSSNNWQLNMISEQSRIYGWDETAERVVLYRINGHLLVSGFRLVKYGNNWRIENLNAPSVALLSSVGAKPVTMEQYLEILTE